MAEPNSFDKIELSLVRLFHTVITERSISRAALRLQTTQPAVSAKLKRLRELTGDPLLVRAGHGMVPTPAALALMEPAADILRSAQLMFGARARGLDFDSATSTLTFRVAASDWLDPLVLPELVGRIKTQAPGVSLEILPLTGDYDYRTRLARADVDLVLGNWLKPPEELHIGQLFSDEAVCLVAADHSAVRNPRWWTAERYLESEHVAPMPLHVGARGVIDDHLAAEGLVRNVGARRRRQNSGGTEHPAMNETQAQHIDNRVGRLVHERLSFIFFEILMWRNQGAKFGTGLRYRIAYAGCDDPGKRSQILEVELDRALLIIVLSLAMDLNPKHIG